MYCAIYPYRESLLCEPEARRAGGALLTESLKKTDGINPTTEVQGNEC
jgi:hypothetical protein